VGKYGPQVISLLRKAAKLDIQMICPLHGPVWRKNLDYMLDKYTKWAAYEPEVRGVLIAFASIYGGTETAANILACRLAELGIPVDMYDVSVTHYSYVLSELFKYSHIVFASATFNNGIFTSMENLLHDVAHHNLQNRKVALIQNGSWAPSSGKLMSQILCEMKNMEILEAPITLKSALAPGQDQELEALAGVLAASVRGEKPAAAEGNETDKPKGFVCKVCGFIYEGDTLPDDFVCPICHRPASDFEPLP
jgi:flavorubredoxin/rubredoxin